MLSIDYTVFYLVIAVCSGGVNPQIPPASAKLDNKFVKSATGVEKPSFNLGRLFNLMIISGQA